MSEVTDRWRRVAGGFTDRVDGVAPSEWDNPAPCEGWVARDVVRHLVEWVPPFLADGSDVLVPAGPDVDDNPAGAWENLRTTIQAVLDRPDVSSRRFNHDRAGSHPLDQAIDMFILGDVLVHTWDLARATGQDETLDPEAVHIMRLGVEPMTDALVQSGQYKAPVDVPDDADETTRLIALTGRQP